MKVWKEGDPATYKKRKAVLGQLKENLLCVLNTPRHVPKCPLYYREKTKFSIGDVFSYTHESGNISYIEVVRIKKKPRQIRLRIDPPDQVTTYDHMHLYDEVGNSLDINGKIISPKNPEANIPI